MDDFSFRLIDSLRTITGFGNFYSRGHIAYMYKSLSPLGKYCMTVVPLIGYLDGDDVMKHEDASLQLCLLVHKFEQRVLKVMEVFDELGMEKIQDNSLCEMAGAILYYVENFVKKHERGQL